MFFAKEFFDSFKIHIHLDAFLLVLAFEFVKLVIADMTKIPLMEDVS